MLWGMFLTRHARPLWLASLPATLGGCDLLPQDSTEWVIALVATGVIIVGSIAAAIIAEKKNDRK